MRSNTSDNAVIMDEYEILAPKEQEERTRRILKKFEDAVRYLEERDKSYEEMQARDVIREAERIQDERDQLAKEKKAYEITHARDVIREAERIQDERDQLAKINNDRVQLIQENRERSKKDAVDQPLPRRRLSREQTQKALEQAMVARSRKRDEARNKLVPNMYDIVTNAGRQEHTANVLSYYGRHRT
jgi:hypothetical protein